MLIISVSIYFSLSLHPGPGIVIVVTSTNNNRHAGVERAHWRDISRRRKYGRHFDASSAGERWSSNGKWLHSKFVIHSNHSKAFDKERWTRQRNARLKVWKKCALRMNLVQIDVTQWVRRSLPRSTFVQCSFRLAAQKKPNEHYQNAAYMLAKEMEAQKNPTTKTAYKSESHDISSANNHINWA